MRENKARAKISTLKVDCHMPQSCLFAPLKSYNSPVSRSTNLANNVDLDVFSSVSEFRRNSIVYFQF